MEHPRPWYTRPDRWDLVVRESPESRVEKRVFSPRRVDPVFGAQVELRVLGRGYEVYVCSGDDDGRYTVRLDRAGLERLDRALEKKAGTALANALLADMGVGRELEADEARFLRKACRAQLERQVR